VLIVLESPVYAADGVHIGKVVGAVVDPATNRVTHLIVHRHWLGLLRLANVIVPVGAIATADTTGVHLKDARADVERYPEFSETLYIPLAPPTGTATVYWPAADLYRPAVPAFGPYPVLEWRRIPPCDVPITPGTVVEAADGPAGQVAGVVTADDALVTALIVTGPDLPPEGLFVPREWVTHIHEDRIVLNRPRADLARLPAARPASP